MMRAVGEEGAHPVPHDIASGAGMRLWRLANPQRSRFNAQARGFPVAHAVVTRPALFAAVLALAAAAFAGAGWSLWRAATDGPGWLVVAVDRDQLPDALADGPFVAAGGAGDVWIVSTPNCPACARVETQAAKDLAGRGVGVRVMMLAPRAAQIDDATRARVAVVAARRDWLAYQACFPTPQAGCEVGALDAETVDGYLEWGRATQDRLAAVVTANDAPIRYPLVFWRAGREWRFAPGADAADLRQVARDVAPGA